MMERPWVGPDSQRTTEIRAPSSAAHEVHVRCAVTEAVAHAIAEAAAASGRTTAVSEAGSIRDVHGASPEAYVVAVVPGASTGLQKAVRKGRERRGLFGDGRRRVGRTKGRSR